MAISQALLRPLPVSMRTLLQTSHRCLVGDGPPVPMSLRKKHGSLYSSQAVVTCSQTVDRDFSTDTSLSGGLDYSGLVPAGSGKVRLDTWLAGQLPRVSRARVQAIIRQGLAVINGQAVNKVSSMVKEGDHVRCKLPAPPALKADPEDIPLEIVFEDNHLLVVNKPAHMVVHPAPGHSGGTLVNALLHHCGLPAMQYRSGSPTRVLGLCESNDSAEGDSSLSDDELEDDEVEDDEIDVSGLLQTVSGPPPVIRPGIVHRLDKGTSGLLVVAKDDYSHAQLCEQFKARSVSRTYVSLSCGVPSVTSGRIEVPIARDVRDRKRMAAVVKSAGSRTARLAASRYRVLEVLGQGGCTLIEWKLETGRTHQIRVHAQHLGHPVLGDEQYGGTEGAVLSRLTARLPPSEHSKARQLVSRIERPCLHAMTIGFKHPWTGLQHNFTRGPPQDFENTWLALQLLGGRSSE